MNQVFNLKFYLLIFASTKNVTRTTITAPMIEGINAIPANDGHHVPNKA